MGLHEARPEALKGILFEARRVLKAGGRLAILDFHRAEGAAGFAVPGLHLFRGRVGQGMGED
ncbi:MAG: hypothetical protein HS130_08255 [Deltaproteobacteria bacterium]|nr:hypothetical protein [Deltaproteobacteria bacterium]